MEGRIAAPGLHAEIEIRRDSHGVPSISAASDVDATFALGYVHAQDRFYQMEVTRSLASGRMAALVGSQAVPVDRYFRALGMARAAERSLSALAPRTRQLLDAYAAGVNAWLDAHPTHRSIELDVLTVKSGPAPTRPWTPLPTPWRRSSCSRCFSMEISRWSSRAWSSAASSETRPSAC